MSLGSVITIRDERFELRRGFKRQSSVILALIFKDFKLRMRTSRFGVLYILIEPLVYVSIISALWYLLGRTRIEGVHILLFVPAGVIPFLVFRRCVSSVPKGIQRNDSLLDYPQVKPIDAIIALFILEMSLLTVASALLMFILWWFLDQVPLMPRPLEGIGVMTVYMAGCFGLALIVAVYGTLYETFQRTLDLMRRPMLIVSGVVWSVDDLPPASQEYLAWNPVLQVIEYVRAYALGQDLFASADLSYALMVAVAMLGIGFIGYYANRYRLVQQR